MRTDASYTMHMSNPAADLARKRWENTTAEERAEVARVLNVQKYKGMTRKQRSAAARKAAQARWAKYRAEQASETRGKKKDVGK